MPLSLRFRQQLATLVQSHDEGCGPVEREAVERLATGLPVTALQIRSFAERHYPSDIRGFLDAHGYEALYQRDLDRALAIGAGGAPQTNTAAASRPSIHLAGKGPRRQSGALRIMVLMAALVAGGVLLTKVLPRLEQAPDRPNEPPAVVLASSPVSSAPPSPCLQSMRDGAAAWCESALTGTVVPGPERGSEPSGCGDRLAVNGDTVRLALDRIFEEEATYTYRHDEVSERCAAAAKLAAP